MILPRGTIYKSEGYISCGKGWFELTFAKVKASASQWMLHEIPMPEKSRDWELEQYASVQFKPQTATQMEQVQRRRDQSRDADVYDVPKAPPPPPKAGSLPKAIPTVPEANQYRQSFPDANWLTPSTPSPINTPTLSGPPPRTIDATELDLALQQQQQQEQQQQQQIDTERRGSED